MIEGGIPLFFEVDKIEEENFHNVFSLIELPHELQE